VAHYPKRRSWVLAWLPDRCGCGARRYDRCPDVIGAPPVRPAPAPPTPANRPRHEGDDPQSRVGHW